MWGPHGSLTGGYFELGVPIVYFDEDALGYASVEYNDKGGCLPLIGPLVTNLIADVWALTPQAIRDLLP